MTYLLDCCVVSYFWAAGRQSELGESLKRIPWAIPDVVATELEQTQSRRKALQSWLSHHEVPIRTIALNTPEERIYMALQSRTAIPHKNRGERALVALAAADPTLVVVSNDRNGMWQALRELWQQGERMIGMWVFLRRLVDQGGCDRIVAEDVSAEMHVSASQPTWWKEWLAADGKP